MSGGKISDWRRCVLVPDGSDDQCRGAQIDGYDRCFTHLASTEIIHFLETLNLGSTLDLRGTIIDLTTSDQLNQTLRSLAQSATEIAIDATEATFTGSADFSGLTLREATFIRSKFSSDASFVNTAFTGDSTFSGVDFGATADFTRATFSDTGIFTGATFRESTEFAGARFARIVNFSRANFVLSERLGPLIACKIDLSGTQSGVAILIEAETGELSCRRARFSGGVELRVRHGLVDLSETFLGAASSVATSARKFTFTGYLSDPGVMWSPSATEEQIEEWHTRTNAKDHRPILTSLKGTDVSELALTDVNLQWCRFAGAHHLDKVRIEGDSEFSRPPKSLWRSSRQVLFEEHPWRASRHPYYKWLHFAPFDNRLDYTEKVGADRLAALYRSLRKALEDGKNEAGAGDFYYGEQEARRGAGGTSTIERILLWSYWLVAGYGQRASRTFAALIVLITISSVLLITCGLATPGPTTQSSTFSYRTSNGDQQTVTSTTDVAPQLQRYTARWTHTRIDASIRTSLGAVVFRDASQKLTTPGVWTVMAARFIGPILLALAALAVRARVKR
ncbi:pentapeptide repeat-containing protein [Amycolatopsis sp. FBCC-B4732]|nr:pentapeptide repeat-containing protein [Amycolatopsis sp. FBCC-B4732]UOX93173.1 pentapeptide repeat-containing protein [Amycolatopsis sp. FBCC-B4732]